MEDGGWGVGHDGVGFLTEAAGGGEVEVFDLLALALFVG